MTKRTTIYIWVSKRLTNTRFLTKSSIYNQNSICGKNCLTKISIFWSTNYLNYFGYALVRPFLSFNHFPIFDLFCTSTALFRFLYFVPFTSTRVRTCTCTSNSVLRTMYFELCTSNRLVRPLYVDLYSSTHVLRPFVKSGLFIGRESQVEVQFWSN